MFEQFNNYEDKNEDNNLITNTNQNGTHILSAMKNKFTKKQSKKEINNIIDDKYEYCPNIILGSGTYTTIYPAKDVNDPQKLYAIKFENSLMSNKLKLEKEIYEIMYGIEGFPSVYTLGTTKTQNYLVIDRLGPSLKELFVYCNYHFSLQTICLIAIQILTRLHDLHFKSGFVYCDIKPDNFLIGLSQTNIIYMIDFGLSKPFRIFNYQTSKIEHIPYKDSIVPTNISRFSSINHQMGIETSRRDDLESLGYMLVYFACGALPWKGGSKSNSDDKFGKMLEKKMAIPIEVYCKDLPIEFSIYLSYVQNLRFNEKPDYNYLKNLFGNLLFGSYIEKFFFDWNIAKPKDIPTNLRVGKELDNKYLYKKREVQKKELVNEVKQEKNKTLEEEKEEEEDSGKSEGDDEDSSSSSSENEEEKEKKENEQTNKNGKPEIESSSSNLISKEVDRSENERLNTEENRSSQSESESNKTEQNSFFNDQDFLSMFSEINANHKQKITMTPQKKNNNFLQIKSLKKETDNNITNTTNNNNTNDELLTKSNRSGVSLNSLNSESYSLLNKNKKIPHLGKLRLFNPMNKMINEEDEDNATSKR